MYVLLRSKDIKIFIKYDLYLLEKVNKKEEQIRKIKKISEEKEMELLLNQLAEGKSINKFDAREIKICKVF